MSALYCTLNTQFRIVFASLFVCRQRVGLLMETEAYGVGH